MADSNVWAQGAAVSRDKVQDDLYRQAAAHYSSALERLARAYEVNPERQRDLLQDIHISLWRSFVGFDEQCSLRTWTYRVAHNVATTYVARQIRMKASSLVSIEELIDFPTPDDPEKIVGERQAQDRLLFLIRKLKHPDQQIVLLYLEGLPATAISEVTGFSSGTIATKIHRIKALLARQINDGSMP